MLFATDNRLPEIKDRLRARFPDSGRANADPLRQLIYGLVSEGAAPAVGVGVFNRLMADFPHWLALRDASPAHLEKLFVGLPRARAKAVAVPALLRDIEARTGDLTLDPLTRMSTEAGCRWLTTLPGVSPALASAVLAFSSLARPTMAVDVAAAQVVRRLGLCPPGAPLSAVSRHVAERAPAAWRGPEFSALSNGLERLAHTVCQEGQALCHKCPLQDLCPSAAQQSATIIPFARVRSGQKDQDGSHAAKVLSK